MTRVGKIKVFTSEGKLIREGHARDNDFSDPKILKYFTASELIRAAVLIIICSFTLGGVWIGINSRLESMSKDASTFVSSFQEFKNNDDNFHRLIFNKFDDKDRRINCLAESLTRCCVNAKDC